MPREKPPAKSMEEAWSPDPASANSWTARLWVHPSERQEKGRLERKRVPRVSHGDFKLRAGRNPIAILEAQEEDRLPDLIPLRHQSMAESPFAYYRGTPAVMAFDLATTPRTDIMVQVSGDAHLSNFGLFALARNARLVFDTNDFDETLPGPWEWDIKRLAASIVIAGRSNGFSAAQNRAAPWRRFVPTGSGWRATPPCASSTFGTSVHHGRCHPRRGREPHWPLSRTSQSDGQGRQAVHQGTRQGRDASAANQLTEVVDGHRSRSIDEPPVIQHVDLPGGPAAMRKVFEDYRATLTESRRDFLERYRYVDCGAKSGRRGQRGDALLRDHSRGAGRGRPAGPPGKGGDRVGARVATPGRALMRTTARESLSDSV